MTVEEFAKVIERKEKGQLMRNGLDCDANWKQAETHIHKGRKWTRVDVGTSGRYMINQQTGQIHSIKAYGVPHLGKGYGNLNDPEHIIYRNHWGNM